MLIRQSKPIYSPPRNFRPVGNPIRAGFCEPPSFAKGIPRSTGKRAEGIRYERRVQQHLMAKYGYRYLPSPWLKFLDGDWRMLQPDGLLFDLEKGEITIIEIKLKHCTEAYWQLRKLYMPVLRVMFPAHLWTIKCVEVVRWYDASVKWPEKYILREHVTDAPVGTIGVHIYNRD